MAQIKQERKEFANYLCLIFRAAGLIVGFIVIMRLMRAEIILIPFFEVFWFVKIGMPIKMNFQKLLNYF